MRNLTVLLYLSALFLFFSCVRIPEGDGIGTDPEKNPWEELADLESEQPILNMYSNGDVLMTISGGEFTRIDADQTILEKRLLNDNTIDFGTPALSENTFARLVSTSSAEQKLEFHLVKNPQEVITFSINELKSNPSESLEIDFEGKEIGAFNFDGNLFLLPVKNLTNQHYSFFLFELELDPSTFQFRGAEITHRIDLTDIASNPGTLSNIKWIGNQFFVATKNGSYRINKDGTARQINNIWMKDFFQWSGTIYGTGFNDFDIIKSDDNGLSWTPATPSPLRLVRIQRGKLVSQVFKGNRYQIPINHQNIFQTREMMLNEDFPSDDEGAYLAIEAFSGNFYLAIGKDLYYTSDIFAVEE